MNPSIKITALNLEIYGNDISAVTWQKAHKFSYMIGGGWRLPNLMELRIIKTIRDIGSVGNFPTYTTFDDSYYWSSQEGEGITARSTGSDGTSRYAYFFDMKNGEFSDNKKSYDLRVRFVRSI